MNLIEIVKRYQEKILNSSVLVDYNLFFDAVANKKCRFVIDEYEELEKLNSVILKLLTEDKEAEIYVNTYSIDFTQNSLYVYADSIWIDTIIEVEEIYNYFSGIRKVEPTDIVLLENDEAIDGTIALVIMSKEQVEDYNLFIAKKQISKIKSLYWD